MDTLELKENFIQKRRSKFGSKFLFNKVDYVNYHTKVIITCPVHGDINMTPDAHIKSKYGCKQCAIVLAPTLNSGDLSPAKTTEEFIEEASAIHSNKYIYTNTLYKNRISPISIICPKHGEFTLPQASRHLEGRGCKQCYLEAMFLSREEYITQANEKHHNYYSYDNMVYVGKKKHITVTCPLHGDFVINAEKHSKGARCKKCRMISKKVA